ncbi:MAG: hypothetical protein LBP76_10750 [Treponema sp.]|nr:hypothetical protein [Treponema sp.]
MKKSNSGRHILVIMGVLLAGCASQGKIAPSPVNDEPIIGPYYSGDGGAGIRIAILEPEGKNLTEGQEWMPSFIQGMLTSDFSAFSAMIISDRQNLGRVLAEQQVSLAQDAEASQSIGKLANVRYILAGSLENISSGEFLLQLAVTDAESGIRRASFEPRLMTEAQLRSASVIKEASAEMLAQMGVELTDAGRAALQRTQSSEIEAAIALARGLTAEKNGNAIETLSYLYNAVSYDSSLLEASGLLENLSADIAAAGTGAFIANDLEAQNKWKGILDEFETFYTAHPPFEFIYVPIPSQQGKTDYEAGTADLKFEVTLRESVEFKAMQNVLSTITAGLAKTGSRDAWGFASWPYRTSLFGGYKNYAVVAELKNNRDESISTVQFAISGRLVIFRNKIYADSKQNVSIVFQRVKIESLTENLSVRIISINGITTEQAADEGFIRISAADKLPAKKLRNLLVVLSRDFFNIR